MLFELCCWRRLLSVPWTSKRSNQSILKEISPEYSLEGLLLKLKLQCFGHLMRRAESFEKTLMLGKIEGGRSRGWERMRWLDGITDSMDMSFSKLQEMVMDRDLACCSQCGHKESDVTEQLTNKIFISLLWITLFLHYRTQEFTSFSTYFLLISSTFIVLGSTDFLIVSKSLSLRSFKLSQTSNLVRTNHYLSFLIYAQLQCLATRTPFLSLVLHYQHQN